MSFTIPPVGFISPTAPWGEGMAKRWADEITGLVKQHGADNRRLAADRIDPAGVAALAELGVSTGEGQNIMEQARTIKSPLEVDVMHESVRVCETGMERMRRMLKPGITENQLWSHLHQANIENGGEWIETRLLSFGPRTNPWFNEAGDRAIEDGDSVSFDTDLIGPNGYCADISCSWLCGEKKPSGAVPPV